jgi:O-antigen/teichoic acid export membrane protein
VIKIFSVFYFFTDDRYLLTEYYLFITILSILGSLISIALINRAIQYDFRLLFKSLKLSSKYYQKGKKLAFSSFGLTLSYIAYHELDLIIIGKWFGIQEVAIYAIGFTFLNFVRNLWNILYSPFAQRLNHFAGQGMTGNIEVMLSKITEYTLPLYVVLVTVLVLGAEYLVLYWVGEEYYSSIIILQMLMISTFLGVVIRPASYYFVSSLKYKYISLQAVTLPVVFYAVIFMTSSKLGFESIAVAKIVISLVSSMIAIKGICGLFSISGILKRSVLPIITFLVFAYLYLPNIIEYVFVEPQKNTENLILYLIFLSVVVIVSYFFIIFADKERRYELKKAKVSYFQNK